MKIIAITGSPRGPDSCIGRLTNSALESARACGAETETFSLADLNILPCKGCYACHRTGRCILKDDFEAIQDAMLGADALVLASPNYMCNVSAQTKALLDRCFCMTHCQSLAGKSAGVVITSAGPDIEFIEEYLSRILAILGYYVMGSVVEITAATMEDKEGKAKIVRSAEELGKKLVDAVKSQAVSPDQKQERQQMFDFMKWLAQLEEKRWPFVYDYWKKRWRMEPDG